MRKPRPFGKVLREFRKAAGLSQEELAHAAGMDRTTPGRLERGERDPSLSTLFTLAKAMRVKLSAIIARME